jgi:hypothetical protein
MYIILNDLCARLVSEISIRQPASAPVGWNRNRMNENRIQQILTYEKRATEIYNSAAVEAERLPRLAEQEVQALIAKTRQQAEEEALALLSETQVDDECARIIDQLEEKLSRTAKLAKMHHDRAVDYTLARVMGLELR